MATNREYVQKRIATVWQQIGICMETHCKAMATNREYIQKRIATVWQQMGNMYGNALQRCGNKWGIYTETHCNGVATNGKYV
ncbi:hypothetical protein [Prevotella pallens]|uniref:hypothetical protein n=1 Tax=Prevotella pallens TaxID=60133 RepID=UPI00288945F6|nr:hypothetical protein [Prevotella pallens]